jgi:3',5'-cyclic AMP phosphodiesterase CpdA
MFTLAHLSDPHLGPLPEPRFWHLMSKRIVGYVNWQQRRARTLQPKILVDLVAAIHAAKPDHIAVTGDLVNIALPEEGALARAWLDSLGDPDHVTLVPGNHDAYVPGALRRHKRLWAPFFAGDGPASPLVFPSIRRRGPLGIVGASSARASMPGMATGHISDRQIVAIQAALAELGREGRFRVLLIHHPPGKDVVFWHQRLVGSGRLRDVVARVGCELILHGHTHMASVDHVSGPGGPIPVVGVPSASNAPGGKRHPAAAFNLYEIEGAEGAYTCHMKSFGYTEPGKPIGLIGQRQLAG